MEIKASNGVMKIEAILRLCTMVTLLVAAVVLLTDHQSRIYFGVYKMRINYKLARIFEVSLYVYFIGAGYTLLHLVRCLAFSNNYVGDQLSWPNHVLKWIFFLLDQLVVYVVFAILCASTQLSILAITGAKDLEWMKLCNKYVRFCFQVGGSIACGAVASLLLMVISGISTFNLFRWYSPNFLCLKPKKNRIVATTS